MVEFVHDTLACGIEYGVVPLPQRHVVAFQIRILAGTASEPADKLGLARVLEETLDKGTERRSGRELSDAFDAIGAAANSGTGRETTTFTCTVLPEHFEQAVALHAEMLRTPTLREDACGVNIELAKQELDALQDDPQALADKYISLQAYGSTLGHHSLGELQTLDTIVRADIEAHWRTCFHGGRMLVSVAGPVEGTQVAEVFSKHFDGFGSAARAGRDHVECEFTPGSSHHAKDTEQQQIGICWEGVDATHDDFPIQQVMLGVLSGGMGARLFTEVREKLGLAYWVSAWHETPRGLGMLFLGASTTPQRCDQTYTTLLHEVERLQEDLQPEEVERAITGIVAQRETRGETTCSRCSELINDLFFFGRPLPAEEKLAKVRAVTVDQIKRYLVAYPHDSRCVVTLGPAPLQNQEPLAHEPACGDAQATPLSQSGKRV